MKLPAVAIAAAFACGIALGLCSLVERFASIPHFLLYGFLVTSFFLCSGLWFLCMQQLRLAATACLLTWTSLGILSAFIASQPLPANHILTQLAENRILLHQPLRWYGQLRDEPARLPWGYGYEIELSGVDYQSSFHPIQGGMRLSFSPHSDNDASQLSNLHAGDQIAFLAQAKQPQIFKDDGAFDRRTYLASQNIHLTAALRAPELLERVAVAKPGVNATLAKVRRRLREELDSLFGTNDPVAHTLRAMLLGDRAFIEQNEAQDFQKTGAFHVLAIAGLHVGAIAALLFWAARRLRLSPVLALSSSLLLLFAYVAVVEQRAPVQRAVLMITIVLLAGFFYRRLEILNSAALAGIFLLAWQPLEIRDSSFQLTFVAIGCIAGLALPWLETTLQPYARALRGWRDVTRDAAHEPRVIQFRIDFRSLANWLFSRLPGKLANAAGNLLADSTAVFFWLGELLVITIVLQIGMLPLMASDFHRVTISAPLVNLIAVPLTGVIVPLGFLTVACAVPFPSLAKILGFGLKLAMLALLHVVHWAAALPRTSYRIPGPSPLLEVLFFSVAILLAVVARLNFRLKRTACFALIACLAAFSAAIAIYPFAPKWQKGKLEMTVLDVGQGDSIFVVFPEGRTLLVDGGGAFGGFSDEQEENGSDPGENAISPYLWSRGYQQIDVVALTHAHRDHIAGLAAILQNFRVSQLWLGKEVSAPALLRLEELARAKHIPIAHETRGDHFSWGGAEGSVLWPLATSQESDQPPKNNDSLIFRLLYRNRTLLLPGDAEKEVERSILADGSTSALSADILKVGHHGSKNSTTPAFLAAVHPRLAIISAGEDNPYGHPNAELLQRLDAIGSRVLRTDRDGAIHVLTDGETIEVSCFVECAPTSLKNSRVAQAPNHEKDGQQE